MRNNFCPFGSRSLMFKCVQILTNSWKFRFYLWNILSNEQLEILGAINNLWIIWNKSYDAKPKMTFSAIISLQAIPYYIHSIEREREKSLSLKEEKDNQTARNGNSSIERTIMFLWRSNQCNSLNKSRFKASQKFNRNKNQTFNNAFEYMILTKNAQSSFDTIIHSKHFQTTVISTFYHFFSL